MSSHNYRLLIAPQAQQDIISILRFTGETWGQEQLLIYRNKLDEALKMIGQNPWIGHRSSELSALHRLYLVGSHVVVVSDTRRGYFGCPYSASAHELETAYMSRAKMAEEEVLC